MNRFLEKADRETRPRSFYTGVYLLSMLIFGTNGLLVARISVSASQIVFMRTLLGGSALTLQVLLGGGFDRKDIRRELVPLLLGGSALGFNWITLFEAYRVLNVSLSTLIYYAGPILILLFSPILFHEKLTAQKLSAIAAVGIGLVLISGSIAMSNMSLKGLFTACLSAVLYAALIAINKRISRTGSLQTAAIELDVAFVVVLFYVLVTVGLPQPEKTDWLWLVLIGLVNTALAYFLYFTGLQILPAQSVALLSYADPVSALFLSAFFLHESMTGLQMLGAALLLGGALWGELQRQR